MEVGLTQTISNVFFPNIKINISDRKGNKLSIGDKVRIYGCAADYGYIGYSNDSVVVYFEADGKSVQWWLNESVRQRIELYSTEALTS